MRLIAAWCMWLPVDLILGIGIFLFTRADKRYQAEKLARLRAEGLYSPDSEHP